ncbi:tetratricopeptide repeat protein [Pedobacter sp. HMF7647]|uniref:Tetratricopeptide repeat protein n=1 Tax=Hufsiella arboris TaxID=2695275 RepID=A0A7K1Y9W8_9SPHI|nr:tetratricopeptide repeat protein [Hufsiella arboris]MXV51364.1 tetratricopeptide repeat protein [Hufsiella arboris]
MYKKYIRITFVFSLISCAAAAQSTAWYDINQYCKSGMELYEKGKYAAASYQFSKVNDYQIVDLERDKNASLIKENAEYYQAVCALELSNEDAESLFLKYIRNHPESANTKSAYFQVGKSYFNQKDYTKSLEWFKKLDMNSLTGAESQEYRFKLGYDYFELKDYNNAEPIFSKLKEEKGQYQESSIYYYAYINYADADYKTALREFERLKNSKQYQSSYPYYLSALYFLDKRYDDVLSYTIPAIQTIDEQYKGEMYRIVAATYFAKNDYKTALDYYLKFQQKDNGKTQNNQDDYQIGYTYFKLGNNENAIKELEKMNSPDIYYQNGMIVLGNAFLKTNNKQGARNAFFRASKLTFDKALTEEGLFNYAKLSYELEFHSVALDATRQFIKAYPKSKRINEAKTLLGEVLLSTKNYKDAVDILESITNRDEEGDAIYQKVTYYRGLEFYNERAFENSISLFMRSQQNKSDEETYALATYWLAEAMFEVRKYGESVAQFEKFLSIPAAKKTDVYNYANYALGYSAFQNESYSKAANYFARFLTGDEKDQNTINDAVLRLGDSYFVLKSYDKAMQEYNRIITSGAQGTDYAMFQKGMIQGLQEQYDAKIATHQALIDRYPNSNYADDAGFEMAYTYFVKGDYDRSKNDLTNLIAKYPRSSYVPRALVTIGLVQYNQKDDEAAKATFERVVKDYSTTDEAKQALESVKNIYLDKGDASGFLGYANTTGIGNLSTYEQDNIMFQAANNLFLKGDYNGAFQAVNAYFDKFPKAVNDKQAKFIRAESLVKIGRPDEAIPDYAYILNDWTSDYTERALISISNLYLKQKKYNEAVVYLKKLETTSEYKSHYGYAINNLIDSYSNMGMADDVLKYATLIKAFEKSSEDDKNRATLYAGKAYLMKEDTTSAYKQFESVVAKTQNISAAEAKYNIANIQYSRGEYKASQKTAFELINKMPSFDYWVAKSFILLADNYIALKDDFQAKSTLQSVIENYKGDDDVLPTAKARLGTISDKK